jgi:hypothetical protein
LGVHRDGRRCPAEEPWTEASKEGENHMKETTLSKITASVRVAKGMAERVVAASPNPQWTEYELQTIDEWIARQGVKIDRSEAIRRLVELGLTVKSKSAPSERKRTAVEDLIKGDRQLDGRDAR